jgi:hypothetical protein
MARTKDTVKNLRAALNQTLHLVELAQPRPDGVPLTEQEAPEYIVNLVRALVYQYQKVKALQDQAVAFFRAVALADRLSE